MPVFGSPDWVQIADVHTVATGNEADWQYYSKPRTDPSNYYLPGLNRHIYVPPMTEFPISCVRCRRRKIKCNKHYPCNQCSNKGFRCEFPAKFRNRSIDETVASRATTDSNTELTTSASPVDVQRLVDEIDRLKLENERLERIAHQSSNEDMSSPVNSERNMASNGKGNEVEGEEGKAFEISGETSELGQKYYGPLSSNTMVESLLLIRHDDLSCEKHHQHMWTSNPNKMNSDSEQPSHANRDRGNYDCPKKPLPWVLLADDTDDRNKAVIKNLVDFFFELPKYHYFLSKLAVLDFIDSHEFTLDDDWDGDDDLLLLHMILVLAIRRMSPARYNLCGITDDPVRSAEEMYKRIDDLVKNRLAWGYLKLRHNLISETFITVQSYILCAEHQFIEQRYEESWSMLFHCCAVAFSIGLHVVVNMDAIPSNQLSRTAANNVDIIPQDASMSSDGTIPTPENDNLYHISKIKTWFALRNITGHVCSILGRPNPILIQLSLKVLLNLNVPNDPNSSSSNNTTMIQLKSGLSECVRLLNLMLIESYIMNVSEQEVLNLDVKFKEEDKYLQYFIGTVYQTETESIQKETHPVTELPLVVDKEDALSDLIILHVNRIKLLERFLSILSGASQLSLGLITESVISFIDFTCEFVQQYVDKEVPQFLDESGKLITEDMIDKVFLLKFPFVSAFIYQGIIVVFILLNTKANELIHSDSIDFLSKIDYKVNLLLEITCSDCNFGSGPLNLWSPNICYLMKQILDRKDKILKQYNDYKSSGQFNQQFEEYELNPSLNEIFRMSGEDPFWATNSDTAPFLLGMNSFEYGLPEEQNEQRNNFGGSSQ